MLYKINVGEENLNKVVLEFKKIGDFCLNKNTFYLDTEMDIADIPYVKNYKIITFNNYKNFSNNSKNIEKWCYDKLYKAELTLYEQSEECQLKLERLNNYMDVLENKWKEANTVAEKTEQNANPE